MRKDIYIAKRAFGLSVPKGVNVIYDAGPSEFLSLLANAMCVVTNSFHGTAFSINFGVPFYSVLKPERGGNSRITSILNQVHLIDRIVYEGAVVDDIHFSSYNYLLSCEYLEELRKSSVKYLFLGGYRDSLYVIAPISFHSLLCTHSLLCFNSALYEEYTIYSELKLYIIF